MQRHVASGRTTQGRRPGWRLKRAIIVGAAVALAAGLLAACSSSSKSSGTATSAASGGSTAAAPTGAPLKFGIVVTQSGTDSSSLSPATNVYKAWVTWTNAKGGINGHPVQVYILDDQASPATGLADTKTLIDGDHVLAVSCMCIGGLRSMGPQAKAANVPQVGPAYNNSWEATLGDANVYEVDAIYYAEFKLGFELAKSLGYTKVGYVQESDSSSAQGIAAEKAAAVDSGLTWVGNAIVPAASPNDTAQCLQLKNDGAEAIDTGMGDQPTRQFMDQCATQGYSPFLIGQAADLSPAWTSTASFAKSGGTIPQFPWWDTSVPAIKEFNDVMKKYDPSALTTEPVVAAGAWATMQVLGYAAAHATFSDTPTPDELRAGLATITNNDFGGLTPPLTYANGGNVNVPLCAYEAYRKGNAFVLGNGGKPACATREETNHIFNIELGKAS